MKLKLCSVILLVLTIQSCCFTTGEEIGREYYTVEEKANIPYADDQNVDFISDENYDFQMSTSVSSTFGSNQDHCEDYTSFEYYQVNLKSELPSLNIQLSLQNRYNNDNDDFVLYVAMSINNMWFDYDFATPLDSLEINGTSYTDVYHYYSGIEDNPISDVFYNKTFGVLKINYTNGDYVQIN